MSVYSMSETSAAVVQALVSSLRKRPFARAATLVVASVLCGGSLIVRATAQFWLLPAAAAALEQALPIVAIASGFFVVVALLALLPRELLITTRADSEISSIRQEREEIKKRLSDQTGGDVFATVQLSLNQLDEYYAINKSQARNSFNFSVFAVVVGLVTLVVGAWLFYFHDTPNVRMATLSGVAGVLAQFIGAAYFQLYRQSIGQMNHYYEQLVRMQYTMVAISLCRELHGDSENPELMRLLIVNLLERSTGITVREDSVSVGR